MKITMLIFLLCLTVGCFAQTSFAVSTTDTILDNVKPTLTLSSPIGGESWYTSIPNTITWTASDLNFGAYPIRLEYSLNGGIDYITIVDSTENDSIHTWQIPAVSSTNTRVKIKATDIFGNSETKSSPSAFFINLPDTWVLEFEPPVLPAANYEISIIPGESAPEVRASFAPSITESIGATITATYSTNLNILSGNFPNPAHLGAYWCFTFSVPNVLTSGSYFDIQMPMQPYQLWYRYNNGNWLLIPGYDKNVFSAPNYTYRVNLLDLIFTKGVGDLEFAGDTGEDEDLPVELSSFTAVTTADCFVNLTWVTESETQVSGYNVYRSETCILRDAIRLNSILVSATNTSEQHSYTILDNEVVINSHYYYWLESVELNASNTMHGPVSVNVIGNTTPIIYVSLMNSAFPNPFRTAGCTNINVSIKTGETGTVTIYNILGQTVKTFPLAAGKHTLAWDGKGSSSGIYFYKLSTPSVSMTKKLVLLK